MSIFEDATRHLDGLTREAAGDRSQVDAWDLLDAMLRLTQALQMDAEHLRERVTQLEQMHAVDTRHGRDLHDDGWDE